MQRSDDVGKIVEFKSGDYGPDAYGVVIGNTYDVMLQPSKNTIKINKDETIPTQHALIESELRQLLGDPTKYATNYGTIASNIPSVRGTYGPNKTAVVTFTPAQAAQAANPGPEQDGGKRARKSRKVRKSRKSHKKYRKSRKARKSRRRARR